jgi:hypothetical protein
LKAERQKGRSDARLKNEENRRQRERVKETSKK